MEFFLRNFAHVPDDKLDWTPVPSAKSALRVAAHTALYAGRFAEMVNARSTPKPDNLEEWIAKNEAEEIAIRSREEVERVFREGTAAFVAALDGLSDEEIESELPTGHGGTFPMKHLMGLAGWHATLHAGQIDYLQTCWDDQEIYLS